MTSKYLTTGVAVVPINAGRKSRIRPYVARLSSKLAAVGKLFAESETEMHVVVAAAKMELPQLLLVMRVICGGVTRVLNLCLTSAGGQLLVAAAAAAAGRGTGAACLGYGSRQQCRRQGIYERLLSGTCKSR
jgi:hypothetical protein